MDQVRSSEARWRTRRGDSATFAQIAPGAPFLSQLIVAGGRAVDEAAAAATYAHRRQSAVRRLPAGYRTSREV